MFGTNYLIMDPVAHNAMISVEITSAYPRDVGVGSSLKTGLTSFSNSSALPVQFMFHICEHRKAKTVSQ